MSPTLASESECSAPSAGGRPLTWSAAGRAGRRVAGPGVKVLSTRARRYASESNWRVGLSSPGVSGVVQPSR